MVKLLGMAIMRMMLIMKMMMFMVAGRMSILKTPGKTRKAMVEQQQ